MAVAEAIQGYDTYPAYKDSGVEWLGEVPEGWEVRRLGSRFNERKTKVSDKDFPPLSVTKNGTVPQLEHAAKSNDGDNRKLVRRGDFVINSRSDRKGSSGIAYQDGSVSLINIVMKPLDVDPAYCNYLLKGYAFVEEFYRMGHGIVADLWTTRYDEMKNIKAAFPPLPEQTDIAEFLDEKCGKIDKTIAQKEKMIALLKERKQIIIQNAVTKGLDPTVPMKDSGVEWLGEIPVGWEVKRLKWILNRPLKYGANESGVEYKENLPRYIRITDFSGEGMLSDKKKLSLTWDAGKDYLLEDGDILFARSGATVGKSYQFRQSMLVEKHCAFAGYLIKASPDTRKILSDFLMGYTASGSFECWKDMIFIKATIENISADKYAYLPIPTPPLPEQTAIVAHIEAQSAKIERAIALQLQQIGKLKEYKASLIDSAVTGKIKVC